MDLKQPYDNSNKEHKLLLKKVFEENNIPQYLWRPMALAIDRNKVALAGLSFVVKMLHDYAPILVKCSVGQVWGFKTMESSITVVNDFLRYCLDLLPDPKSIA